jgi:putative endonuclease
VEQLVARRAHNPKVARSSRVPATKENGNQILVTVFCFYTNSYFMFVTYVLYSKQFDKIYVGYTSDLINRFHSHNLYATKGYTVSFRPWEVLLVEFYDTKSEAMRREKALKSSRGRAFIRDQVGLISVS